MKISCLSMVRNEGDIIETWCRHVSALFDAIVVIDHASEDGTREYLGQLGSGDERFHVYDFVEPAYEQSALMTFASKTLQELRESDWLFLLDADELLPFADRDAFRARLRALDEHTVIAMDWSNLVPSRYTAGRFDLSVPVWRRDGGALHRKIAFRPIRIGSADYCIAQGNHQLLIEHSGKSKPMPSGESGFPLLHLPIRSAEQFSLKLAQGIAAYALRNRSADPLEGFHWSNICDVSRASGLEAEVLNWVAANYGAQLSGEPQRVSAAQLQEQGYREERLALAQDPALPPAQQQRSAAETMLRVCTHFAGDGLRGPRYELMAPELAVDGQRRIFVKAGAADQHYAALADIDRLGDAALAELDDNAFIWRFLRPAFWPIKCLTPSSWAGHIPFMFCLITALQPRRYVELGSHHGASFFAACQAAQRSSPSSECIAVDSWLGDEHAGYYDNSVFKSFRDQLNEHFSDVGTYLRCSFDDAAAQFEPASIDLLHIDGLHTYEAVRHDFETWQDRLTPHGVIIFHDINVHERDFGVWQLWQELGAQYLTTEFFHSHGLGILCLNQDERNPIVRLARLLNANPDSAASVQWFLQNAGELGVQRAQVVELSSDTTDLKLQIKRLKRELKDQKVIAADRLREIRQSTSWRLTAPLRWVILRMHHLARRA